MERLSAWMLLLQKYYQGYLCKYADLQWEKLINALAQEDTEGFATLAKGYAQLKSTSPRNRREMMYEFNRLFVGPDAPKAPPYEACYRNPERTLMQEETLAVRAFYRKAGLEIKNLNTQPDDFIAFELEFLLGMYADGSEEKTTYAKDFLQKHLLVWTFDHVKEIRDNTKQPVILSMATILEGVSEALREELA